ncbi:recombinase family protein [Sphingoaurantiacus capsulatus]|uniref:Recombinase family protein n=1 Tax=Sphingoaurantiacus capsulatus TaxID=1771310 RepID=A0ABV7XCN3_9SPHN
MGRGVPSTIKQDRHFLALADRNPIKLGYARADGDARSLARQEAQLRKAGCAQLFSDADGDPPPANLGLKACLEALRPGDMLVTTRLDRPAHSLANLVELLDGLTRRGIAFRSLDEDIDTGSTDGPLISRVIGVLASFQRSLISEKTRAGMAAAQAQGQHVGRPRSLDDEQIAAARHAIEKDGEPPSAVAARFGVHPRTLQRLMHGEAGGTPPPSQLTRARLLRRPT